MSPRKSDGLEGSTIHAGGGGGKLSCGVGDSRNLGSSLVLCATHRGRSRIFNRGGGGGGVQWNFPQKGGGGGGGVQPLTRGNL